MSVTTVRLQTELEQERWQQTLAAMESAAQGKIADAGDLHNWLHSWGSDKEQDAPSTAK